MEYAIEASGLSKQFKNTNAVSNLNLKVPYGSIFAFLGPNGAGKTTTIKTLLNIFHADAGESKVLGVDSARLGPEQFSQIGYVSENQELPEWMSVGHFLKYCKSMYATWDDKFCESLIEQFDLPTERKLSQLSRGMKMKAALVSSLSYRPKLLVFDEPFSGLDALVREEFINGVLEITANESWTIFVSSHDIEEVERLADWVGIIDKGQDKIVEQTESLQARFKRIDVTLGDNLGIKKEFPDEWLLPEQENRALKIVHSEYKKEETEKEIGRFLSVEPSSIAVRELSLREIFLVLAKQYRLSDSRGV